MKTTLKVLGMSCLLVAPLALAAPLPQANGYGTPMMVGQTSQEMNAYDNSKYGYWDARVLALFWGSNIGQAKAFIGSEVMAGGPSPASVDQKLTIARDEAMKQAQQLRLYHETYNFNDAQDLAKFWGLANPFDAKVRMEQKLIWGDEQLISDSLRQARVNTAPPPQNPPTNPPPNNNGQPPDGQVFSLLPIPAQMTNTARPNFQAQFSTPPDRRTLRFVVDQIDHSQEVSYSSSGKTIRWTPSTNLMPGNHVVDVSAVGQNRETFATHWTFTTPRGNSGNGNPIQPPPVNRPTGLQVNNINPGVVLGSRFNVSGRGVPGSSVTVQVEYPKQDIVSQMTGVMLRFQSQGRVDNNGNFSIPMDAQEVPRGEPMTITVTDSANSPIVSVRTEKGADNQVQPNGGNSNPPNNGSFNPSNNVERFYDQQNHFGMDIPRGWGRVSPDPKTQFKISNNRGGFFGVGAGQARNPQEVTNTLIIELNKQGNRVNSQKQIKLGGLSATRIDFTSNNNSNSGGVVVSCVTGRNQTFIVGAESSNMSDFQFTQDLNSLLNTFRINTP